MGHCVTVESHTAEQGTPAQCCSGSPCSAGQICPKADAVGVFSLESQSFMVRTFVESPGGAFPSAVTESSHCPTLPSLGPALRESIAFGGRWLKPQQVLGLALWTWKPSTSQINNLLFGQNTFLSLEQRRIKQKYKARGDQSSCENEKARTAVKE